MPIFRILSVYHTNLGKSLPSETVPRCLFVVCILHTEQTSASLFSESYIYSTTCLPQTQKVVVSSQLHWLLVCFGQLNKDIHVVRKIRYLMYRAKKELSCDIISLKKGQSFLRVKKTFFLLSPHTKKILSVFTGS